LAIEWGKKGVRVNAIAPGVFTDLNQALLDGTSAAKSFMRTPMNRFGKVEELASRGLASDARVRTARSSVDGGFLASGVNR
jgi:NAD(P)-dependent dehydrogenase (short-subunit alcohol dehydrogenase family)